VPGYVSAVKIIFLTVDRNEESAHQSLFLFLTQRIDGLYFSIDSRSRANQIVFSFPAPRLYTVWLRGGIYLKNLLQIFVIKGVYLPFSPSMLEFSEARCLIYNIDLL